MRKKTVVRLVAAETAALVLLTGSLVIRTAFAAPPHKPEEPVGFTAPAVEQTVEALVVEAPEEWVSRGEFRLTFYCPCRKCSGRWGHKTASGATCKEGRTIAVDKDVIPLGTEVRIGDHVFVAEDTGVEGKSIDIFMESHEACRRAGVQYSEIYIKKPKEGKT